jgi:hypothetical protein
VACIPALACKALLAQATERWPNRSRRSDGICPSAAHSAVNPTSDHERGNAVDLTHDPANGPHAHNWARELVARRDPRVTYVISNGEIANSTSVAGFPPWTWRRYNGANPHTTHAHVSIKSGARDDTSPWFPTPSTPDPLTQEEDVLTADQSADLKTLKNYAAVQDPKLDRIIALLEQIAAAKG